LYQQQTAHQTSFLAAAANATRRLFTGAANAIKRAAFPESSSERMQLALAHLQTCTQQTPQVAPTPAPTTPTPAARAVLEYFRAAPLSVRENRILRIISSTYYADGCCYAQQETLARAVGCAKSTLQQELDELEARNLLHVTPRDGTSNVTHLADGVREALRFQRIENRRRALARRGVAPLASKSPAASSPMPPKPPHARVAASPASVAPSSVSRGDFKPKKRAKSEPKTGSKNGSALVVCSTIRPEATTWPEHSTSRTKDCISDTSYRHVKTVILSRVREGEQAGEARDAKSEKIHVQGDENHVQSSENTNVNEIDNAAKPHKKPAFTSLTTKHVSGENGNEKQGKAPARSRKAEHTAPQNGKEGEKKAIAPSVSSHPERTTAAALLIAEGVTPKRAGEFAQLFDHDQIERTIALGLHRTKKNPPGYLLTLIRDDPASRRIAPGSEADQIRQRERPAVRREQNGPVKAREAREPVPGAVSPVQPKQRASEAICGTFSGGSDMPGGVEDPLEALPSEDRDRYVQRAREEVLRAKPWLGAAVYECNGPLMQAMIRTQLRALLATPEASASRGAPSG
jgi:DNA-binding MarR family transcriptional regulator